MFRRADYGGSVAHSSYLRTLCLWILFIPLVFVLLPYACVACMLARDHATEKITMFAENFKSENPISKVMHVFELDMARAQRYSQIPEVKGMREDGSNARCVIGYDQDGKLTEMIVKIDDEDRPVDVWQVEDKIMMEPVNLYSFPEYQYDEGGPWRMCPAGATSLEAWRDSSFKLYEKALMQTPPECLASLGRMLHLGPVTQLYGRADDPLFPMPEEEKGNWTVLRNDGKKTYLPRPLNGLRMFNITSRLYTPMDMRLKGAPPPDAEEAWFVSVVKHLKSNFQGSAACDETFLDQNEKDLLCQTFRDAVESAGSNKWTELVFSTKGEVKK